MKQASFPCIREERPACLALWKAVATGSAGEQRVKGGRVDGAEATDTALSGCGPHWVSMPSVWMNPKATPAVYGGPCWVGFIAQGI